MAEKKKKKNDFQRFTNKKKITCKPSSTAENAEKIRNKAKIPSKKNFVTLENQTNTPKDFRLPGNKSLSRKERN